MTRGLAAGALILALGTLVAGERPYAPAVSAVTLAEWIRARRNVDVVDLRAMEQVMLHIPTAVHADRAEAPWDLGPSDTVVTVDEHDASSRTTARALRARGMAAFWLQGGEEAWNRDILNLTIEEGASDSAMAAFRALADLSRYFGGVPRIVPAGTAPASVEATVRRGCGFED